MKRILTINIIVVLLLTVIGSTLYAENDVTLENVELDTLYYSNIYIVVPSLPEYFTLAAKEPSVHLPRFCLIDKKYKKMICIFVNRYREATSVFNKIEDAEETTYRYGNYEVIKRENETALDYEMRGDVLTFQTFNYAPQDSNLLKEIIFNTRIIERPDTVYKQQKYMNIKEQ